MSKHSKHEARNNPNSPEISSATADALEAPPRARPSAAALEFASKVEEVVSRVVLNCKGCEEVRAARLGKADVGTMYCARHSEV